MTDAPETEEIEADIPGDGLDLMGQLVMQNYRDYVATTSRLVDNLSGQNTRLQATLHAIRAETDMLLSGPWMPTPDTIAKALWPSEEVIDQYMPGVD